MLGISNMRIGLRLGMGRDLLSAVTRDNSSGILVPRNALEWSIVLEVADVTSGGPSAVWLLQETSGNPADSVGSFTLTAGASLSYQQSVTGWARKAIATPDGVFTSMSNSSASLPDVATTSFAVLAYVSVSTVAAVRGLVSMGTPNFLVGAISATNKLSIRASGDGNTDGTETMTGAARPIWLTMDRTASAETLVSDQEALTLPFTTNPNGKQVRLGAAATAAATCSYRYGAAFFGAAAELTDAQRKRVLQTLGWTVPW